MALIASIRESILCKYSKDWDSAFDKTLVAALEVWKKDSYTNFVEGPNPHLFPSFRSIAIRALEALDELHEKKPMAD